MWRLVFLTPILTFFLWTGCPASDPQARILRPTSSEWDAEINAFEKRDRTNPPPTNPILFIGSSSIRLWKSLETDFPRHTMMNRGFGGSQIIDSVYFADRIVFPYSPRKIVMYAGANDINAGKSPEQVFHDFELFVETVHQRLPKTQIAYIAISPNPARWKQIDQVREANRLIRNYARRKNTVTFIDTHSRMLNERGTPLEGIFKKDNLHMNEKGYKIWEQVIGPTL